MSLVFFRSDGTPCAHPTSFMDAWLSRAPRYDDGEQCPACNATSVCFTEQPHSCVQCARLEALQAYSRHTGPVNVRQALADGVDHYMRPEMCIKAGHIGKRTLSGHCYLCTYHPPSRLIQECYPELVISRQAATALGLSVYRTGKLCGRGHTAYRYLSTGGCLTCKLTNLSTRAKL